MKTFSIALIGILAGLVPAAVPALAQSDDFRYGHHMWSDGWGWGGMFMGGGMMVLFMIIVIVAIIVLVKGLTDAGGKGSGNSSSALDILNERYARGEIDTAEYNERKKVITG